MTVDPIAFENQRPEWQRWLNQFCENWIFAFLIAMAIRHFAIEAFRIPTASMEPMLYGDPGLLTGDHVVVDKITAPFTGYHRWDVTVFQFPRPEIEGGKDARPALTVNDERLDSPLLSPLFCRNFVKRILALPGDTFYFSGGDLHLKQANGTFAIARKPEKVQEALWQDIYEHGAQAGYLPWAASKGAQVEAVGDAVNFTLSAAEATVSFSQPLRNVYVKPGKVHVTRRPASDAGATVEVAMTKPLFVVGKDQGNLWDLDSWKIERTTSDDLDHGQRRELNRVMDEWVGDVRLNATLRTLTGTVVFHLSQGQAPQGHDYALELTPAAWRLSGDGVVLAQGEAAPVGKKLQFTHLDGQVVVALDGQELARKDVPDVDPSVQRLRLWMTGSGAVTLGTPLLQRDLHYCTSGILKDNAAEWRDSERGKNDENQLIADKAGENQRLIALVRTQMRGGNLTSKQLTERWGYSPETAITVPPDCYLLMGDNSPFSWDGRFWGYVPGANLRGRVFAVMFPPQRWKLVR